MSLRVLQLMNRVPWPLKDGGAIGYYNYTKGYADAGCKVTVAALNTSRHHVETLPAELTQYAAWHITDINTDVKPIPAFLNLFTHHSYHVSRFNSPAFLLKVKQLLKEQEFDVIVFESLFMAGYLDEIKPLTNALLVLREHNIEHHIWQLLAANEKNPLKKWYLSLLAKRLERFERNNLNKFDGLTTVTEDDAAALKKMGCRKPVFVSPAGVDCSKFLATHTGKNNYLFFLGSLEWLPNIEGLEWFIHSVWPLIKNDPALGGCEVAGRNMPARLKQFSDDKLAMIGEVDDALAFMHDKQLMIVPLFSGSGIRVKILEGMAMGKTIVCTTLAMQGIECDNGVHLIMANSPVEFATAIKQCLNDETMSRQIGSNARRLVEEKYENKKLINHILEFYKQQIQ